ncbi:hypothetical protein A9Q84_19255 [Halobacteriovorax marinus]|uniref:Alcohol dehydrogenase-like N-terminal domain-containing protein n=1 Tax=Halobacteriovorax marinus TaxID=97084 RepID=A0A1Y5F889_9BACT|nr:hypothetical protein A9Q84_19255 [Halobacteriovorax marinus]
MKITEWKFSHKAFLKSDLTLPSLQDGEVLISVEKVGICGSDLFAMETVADDSVLRLGHEWVGRVVESLCDSLEVGDLVTSTAVMGCGACKICHDEKSNLCQKGFSLGGKDIGMIRTKAILPASQLLKVTDFSLNEIVLLEVAAVAEEALSQISKLGATKDHRTLIFGGGPVGILTALRIKEEGFNYTLIETDRYRIQMAKDLELNILPLPMALTDSESTFDYIIDTSGDGHDKNGFWKYMNFFTHMSSHCLIVGKYKREVEINSNLLAMKNITLKWMRGMPKETLDRAIVFWKGKFEVIASKIISHEFHFDNVQEAFDKALIRDECMKIVINVAEEEV